MTYSVNVRPQAAEDIAEAYAWYESQQSGLGSKFLDAVETAIVRIADGPKRYAAVLHNVRRTLIRRFPYSIYFRAQDEEVRVIAVLHQHRDPRMLRRRIS